MSISLQVVAGSGPPTSFEHAGPVVRIGRDPDSELSLAGDAGSAVSRQHARIDLGPRGAVLSDAGSSNGTLLNGRLIEAPCPLHSGDRIQLGFTGPTLTVVRLTLPSRSARRLRAWPVGAAVAAAVLLVGLIAVWISHPSGRAEGIPTSALAATTASEPPPPTPPPPPPPPSPPPPPPITAPTVDVQDVGAYVLQSKETPSVLLQREGNGWARLRPESPVPTATTLLSLPGYRCDVALDSGLTLTLWGNLYEFCHTPPLLLESVVMLNKPVAGLAADVSLDRGRIRLARHEKGEALRARLRFLREVWDVTMHDADSEVCAQLSYLPLRPTAGGQREILPPSFEVFTRGGVSLRTPAGELTLRDFSRVSWDPRAKGPLTPVTLRDQPDWWPRSPDSTDDRAADAQLSLKDWSDNLKGTGDLVEQIKGRVDKEKDDVTDRALGVQFLAAFDELPYLVNFLMDGRSSRVRRGAAHALRSWLARHGTQVGELEDRLKTQTGNKDTAALILRLLLRLPPDDLRRPKTYQDLIGWLDHEHPAVRELACGHLEELFPDKVPDVPFQATAPANERARYVQEWRQRVPNGTIPTWAPGQAP